MVVAVQHTFEPQLAAGTASEGGNHE
jgi:hypothetical protein